MLIFVLDIKVTCEWHKAIKLNYKNTRTHGIIVLRIPSTIHEKTILSSVACPTLRFSTLFHKWQDLKKKVIKHKIWVYSFSTTFICNTFHSKKNWARCDRKCLLVFLYSTLYSCSVLMKLEFSQLIFKKYSNKFHENPSSGSQVVPCRRTDMMKQIVTFRNSVNVPKNKVKCGLKT